LPVANAQLPIVVSPKLYGDVCPKCSKIHEPMASIQNEPSKEYTAAVNEAVAGILKDAHNGNYNAELASITAQELAKTVQKEYGEVKLDWNAPDTEMTQRLTQDVWQFSSAKNYQEMRDLSLLLKNDKGELRPFSDFENEAKKVTQRYNQDWMKTEYNLAVASSQNAARWVDFHKDKETIPNLEYQTIGDTAVRTEHQALDGVIKSIDDSFWATHYPPNGYGCRCEAVQTLEKDTTPANRTPDVIVPKLFQTNLANESMVFPKGHPYYKDIPEHVLIKTLDKIPLENAFMVDSYKKTPVLAHVLHEAHELHNNKIIAKTLIDNYKSISKIELLPNISDKEMELKKRFYPKDWHKYLNAKNPDSLIQINGKDTVVEFKYLVGSGKHIIRNITDASEKSEYAVIMMTEQSILKQEWLKKHLDKWFLNNEKKQFKGVLVLGANGKELYKKSDIL
jgi:SPP1 gp7 family putative phage head morphogenesis protein